MTVDYLKSLNFIYNVFKAIFIKNFGLWLIGTFWFYWAILVQSSEGGEPFYQYGALTLLIAYALLLVGADIRHLINKPSAFSIKLKEFDDFFLHGNESSLTKFLIQFNMVGFWPIPLAVIAYYLFGMLRKENKS